jgi:hypothetical protein
MNLHMQRAAAAIAAVGIFFLQPAPVRADEPALATADPHTAAQLFGKSSCSTPQTPDQARLVAQSAPTDSPSPTATDTAGADASPSPSASPTIGPPQAPHGPEEFIPKPIATGAVPTPPPLPTASPLVSSSPDQMYIQQYSPAPNTPVPAPNLSAGPLPTGSPSPSPSPTPAAEMVEPGKYYILGDTLTGPNIPGQPRDLDGHVNIIYVSGVLAGDHAHYDGTRYIDVTGHTFVRNASGDTTLYADSVRFDTFTNRATLINGRGESTQGVEVGKLHFKAAQLHTEQDGHLHGDRAYLTTCENPRAGYHMEGKTLDVYPGDKAVIHSAVLYLGALAVFYLPVVVISLAQQELGSRKQPGFLPVVGYDSTEGFYVKARIGFSPSDYYYGYYRIEEYTKLGLGLGYVGTIKRKDNRRQTDIAYYRPPSGEVGQGSNLQINDQENFSANTRGQFGVQYTGNYGPLVNLPPQYNLTAAIDHGDAKGDHENYSFTRQETAGQSSTTNYGITDHRAIAKNFTNDTTLSYTTSELSYEPGFNTETLHASTDTHLSESTYDYELLFDIYGGTDQQTVDKEPELRITPHNPLFPRLKAIPITAIYTIGDYDDPTAPISTSRGEAKLNIGPVQAHFLDSDFQAGVTVQQDAYATGDLKAQIAQNASLTTPLFNHLVNTLTYSESHVNGPLAEPFKSLDILSDGSKQAQDVLRVFNSDVYTFSLTSTTYFDRAAQPLGYQITARPSPRSTIIIGGAYTPGSGYGFQQTTVQFATPFGYESDLQFATVVDWTNHGRLESKNIYYRHIVGDCYQIVLSYNEDVKQVNLSVNLLAFPSHVANFGIGQGASLNSIIPQNLSQFGTSFGQ